MAFFKTIQLNCRSFKANKNLIEALIHSQQTDIIILCETWMKPDELIKLNGYNSFQKNRDDGYGGVAILAKNNYISKVIHVNYDPIEFIEVQITKNNLIYTFISLYIPPIIGNNRIEAQLKSIFKKYENTRRLFIGGDFNAHHPLWDADIINADTRGNLIASEITSSNLHVLNNGNYTYHNFHYHTFSAIDLSLISNDYINIVNWTITEDNVGSDHLPILIEIGKNDSQNLWRTVKKIDMELLQNKLLTLDFNHVSSIEEFEELLIKIINDCTKIINTKQKHTPKAWWTEKIQLLWNIKRNKQKLYFKNKTMYTAIELKRSIAILKCEIRIQKENTWNTFIQELNPNSTLKSIYRKINIFTDKKKTFSNYFLDSDDKLNRLLTHNFAISNTLHHSHNIPHPSYNTDIIDSNEIKSIIHSNKNTAPGLNHISNSILKMLNERQIETLTKLLNDMWNKQSFPKTWNEVKGITFAKPGKDANNLENYRVISLQNVIYKVFNKHLKRIFNEIIISKSLLPKDSYGFRGGVGVNEFAVNMVKQLEQNKREKYYTVVISMDLEKAFDRVNTDTLINMMSSMGFDDKYLYWIYQMLTNRKLILQNNEFKANIILNDGVPQGDVLSPLLFNLYTSKIHTFQREDIRILQYADDITIIIKDKNITELNTKANQVICSIKLYLATLNFNINFSKTKFMCLNLSIFQRIDLNIFNDVIMEERELKILGIIFDNKMQFIKNCKEVKNKCAKYINVLKIFSNKKCGAHPKTLLNAYKALIKSRITFGLVATNIDNKKSNQMMQVTINAALRCAMSFVRTTPITAILAESNEMPFKYIQKQMNFKFICKHIFNHTEIGHDILNGNSTNNLNKTYIQNPLLKLLPHNKTFIRYPPNIRIYDSISEYSKNNRNEINRRIAVEMIHKNNNKQSVYTDASIMDNEVGIGIHINETKENISYKLKQSVSIKTAEMFAIFLAIKFMFTMKKNNFIIYTDSKSSCSSLINTLKTNHAKYYEQLILELMNSNDNALVTIQWIPAHIGIEGNEIVDKVAKDAILMAESVEIKIPPEDLTRIHKQSLHTNWTQEFLNITQTKGTFHAHIVQTPTHKTWFHNSTLSSHHIRIINRLRSGHTYDKKYRHLMKREENNICELCNILEDAKHIIDNCIKHNTIRHKYTSIQTKGLHNILKDGIENEYIDLLKFIEEAEISL